MIWIIISDPWTVGKTTTTKKMFEEVELIDLKQLHQSENINQSELFGTELGKYRTYNPSITTNGKEIFYAYRISNYNVCKDINHKGENSLITNWSKINSFIVISNNNDEIVNIEVPNLVQNSCAKGFEDPRILIQDEIIYIISGTQTGQRCTQEMWLLKIDLNKIKTNLSKTNPKSIKIDSSTRLYTDFVKQLRPEKNWSPFFIIIN